MNEELDLKKQREKKVDEYLLLDKLYYQCKLSISNSPTTGETFRLMKEMKYKMRRQKRVLEIDIRILEDKLTVIYNDKIGKQK